AAQASKPAQTKPANGEGSVACPSFDSLIAAAVAGLYRKDTLGVFRLSFDRKEFLGVYSGFESDTSRDRRKFATGFYLEDNRKSWLRILGNEATRPGALSRYTVDGPVVDYKKMVLYKGVHIFVR